MNEIITNNELNIEDMIHEIRGEQVMLDSDLAKLYQCTNGTKDINKAVKRNIGRFPKDFYFQLTEIEKKKLWFQNGTANNMSRTEPYVFTEQGVAMLASVLKTPIAAEISVRIMRAFVLMKQYVSDTLMEQKYINNMLLKHDKEIRLLQESFKKFDEKKVTNEIYFNGQIYDAYSKIVDILNEAKKEIIIIDGYADKTTLDIISNTIINTILITKKSSNMKNIAIRKYNEQYKNLKIIYNETFHDRYIIVDRKTIYHLGTSINYAGSRTFSINVLEDKPVKEALINKVITIINE